MVSKNNVIFKKILSDRHFQNAYPGINPSVINDISAGKRSSVLQVKVLAEIISDLNLKIQDAKADMRIRRQTGPVRLKETDMQMLYRKIVALLTK